MKYILLMQFPIGPFQTENMNNWPEADIQNNLSFLKRFNRELSDAGELVAVEALAGPEHIKLIRSTDGTAVITDGPFPESKEFLAGYWIVDVESEARAIEIAARASAMPARGGVPANIPIEVRAVMKIPTDGF